MKQANILGTMMLALGAAVLGAPSAFAQSSTPNPGAWVTNGIVRAIAQSGDTTYIGGDFTYVGPNTGSGVPFDAATGQPVAPYAKVFGTVRASVPDGSGGWYIGGEFTTGTNCPRISPDGFKVVWMFT